MDKQQQAIDLPATNVQLLHKKNSVIHMVRLQMLNFERKYSQQRKRRSYRIYRRFWHHRYYILLLVAVALLAWLSIMYGAIIYGNMDFCHVHIPSYCWPAHTNEHIQFLKAF